MGEAAGVWQVCQGRRSKRGWDRLGQRAGEELGPPSRVWPLALNLGCPTPKGSMERIHELSREKLHLECHKPLITPCTSFHGNYRQRSVVVVAAAATLPLAEITHACTSQSDCWGSHKIICADGVFKISRYCPAADLISLSRYITITVLISVFQYNWFPL